MSLPIPLRQALFAWALGLAIFVVQPVIARAGETHVVANGETLSQIAQRHVVDVADLVALNGIGDPDRLSVGQELKLPPGPSLDHDVQAGDTLTTIAHLYGVAVDELIRINGLIEPDRLSIGMTLSLPASMVRSNQGTGETPSAAASGSADLRPTVPYLVTEGDTLGAIARAFETTVEHLLLANGLNDPDLVVVGQTLQLPARTLEHRVSAGETLSLIASSYSVDLGSLVDLNDLSHPDLIRSGDVIAVPLTSMGRPAEASVAAPAQPVIAEALPAVVESSPSTTIGERIVELAQRLLGRPYVWGGSSESGFDCSGLVWYVAAEAGVPVSRGLFGQFEAGFNPERHDLAPGDLVFFQNTYMPGLSHNGIYIGNGAFVHAADENHGVIISRLEDDYWATRYFGATRLG